MSARDGHPRGDCLADGIVSMSYVLWETLVWNILNTRAEATGEFFFFSTELMLHKKRRRRQKAWRMQRVSMCYRLMKKSDTELRFLNNLTSFVSNSSQCDSFASDKRRNKHKEGGAYWSFLNADLFSEIWRSHTFYWCIFFFSHPSAKVPDLIISYFSSACDFSFANTSYQC